MNKFVTGVLIAMLTAFAVGSFAPTASATPTEQYPIDPAAAQASTVYPGPALPGRDFVADPSVAQSKSATQAAAAPFVTVPSNYVYNPNLQPVARHDYCTSSPDSYFAADFRGPCARHDLCYDAADAAGRSYTACNSALRTDMITNCAYAYGSGVAYTTCVATADIYWAAVTLAHL
ncbi:phospholipase A2 [Williamsia sp. CHRR-6]|uniref:phospholipase A2 n=1 Tax=Williamsia sp. CHRR-6 TaxID=2835871 RepID=UPI001BD9F11D|nr:phospholipase A2 [Williamsia sp. CHRR-6]MBT0568226.1 hypothetical protein [Williamsia sp. CHRR-6]